MEVSTNNFLYLDEIFTNTKHIKIKALFSDSRIRVENGMFFCVKGLVNDGHKYVSDAINNGAVAIVYSDDLDSFNPDVHYIKVENVLETLNVVAKQFYLDPSSKLAIFGVSGTNGKTTTASIIRNLLNKYQSCGYIGTINIQYANKIIPANYTTPEIINLNETLADMVKEDVKALAIEISSHALEQKRVDSIDVDYAIFTNLTHEHLDYHGNMENYFLAKAKLFENLDKNAKAIVNIDDDYGKRILEISNGINITYGIDNDADYKASNVKYFSNRSEFDLIIGDKTYPIVTNLVAKFNIYNLLASIIALVEYGLDIETIVNDVKQIKQVDGRVEQIDVGQSMNVIVDYAHTPAGFEEIFEYANKIKGDNKVIVVFGSAGGRDVLKRPMLGEIADKYCDMIILTEEDPRHENVGEVCNEIARGIKDTNYIIIERRSDAIYQAIELANSNDLILILGKGNEKFIITENGRESYLGDNEVAKLYLKEMMESNDE